MNFITSAMFDDVRCRYPEYVWRMRSAVATDGVELSVSQQRQAVVMIDSLMLATCHDLAALVSVHADEMAAVMREPFEAEYRRGYTEAYDRLRGIL